MKSIIDICQGSWGLEKNYILLPCHEILSKVEYVSIYLGSDTDLTYCGRTETHEALHRRREDDVDADPEPGEGGHEVDLGHVHDGVQLPGRVPGGLQAVLVPRGADTHRPGLE